MSPDPPILPVTDETARRLAAAIERLATVMERGDEDERELIRDRPRGHVRPNRRKRVARDA